MRPAASRVRAGTFTYEGDDLVTGWHHHDLHQLEYALEGVMEVEAEEGHYLLPPQQAVWIPAGTGHESRLCRVRSVSVFFTPSMVPDPDGRIRVLAATPLVREMLLFGRRWPISRARGDADSDRFFAVLAALVAESLDHELPLCLPTSRDPLVAAAMAHTGAHLAGATEAGVGAAVGASPRTLRRRFAAAGTTWRAYLLQSRVLRAAALLAESDASVTEVALAVGFDSPSSFSRAFRGVVGRSPADFRRQVGPR